MPAGIYLRNLPPIDRATTFSRFNPDKEVPTINPERFASDLIYVVARINDGENPDFLVPIDSCEFTYNMYGKGQPFFFETSIKRLQAILKEKTKDTSVMSWVGTKQRVLVDIFVQSKTGETNSPYLMQRGYVDKENIEPREDQIRIQCRDESAAMWEFRYFGVVNPAPSTLLIAQNTAKFFEVNDKAYTRSGELISTLLPAEDDKTGNPKGQIAIGILDARYENRYLVQDGIRAWDLLQTAARIDDVYAFVHKGTLWYISENALARSTGKFVLTYGKNIEDIDYEYSPFQSQNSIVIMAFTDGKGLFQGSDSGTAYIIVESLEENPRLVSKLTPQILQEYDEHAVYRIRRLNLDSNNPEKVADEARAYYRELASKEALINFNIAGHIHADLLNQYFIYGTGESIVDGKPLIPRSITHTISIEGGWNTAITATPLVELSAPSDNLVTEKERETAAERVVK